MATPLTEEENLRRRVPAAPPVVRPAAAQLALPPPSAVPGQRVTPTTVLPPRNPTVVVDSVGRAGVGGIPASPVQTPAYRTPTGFAQTPTPVNPAVPRPVAQPTAAPVNPSYRAPPAAAAQMGAAPAAAGVRPAAAARAPAKLSGMGKLGLAVEAANVVGAGMDGGIPAAAEEAAGSVARLGASAAGARLGGMLPGPLRAPGAIVGGVAGYIAGQKGVDAVKGNLPSIVNEGMALGADLSDPADPGQYRGAASRAIAERQAAGTGLNLFSDPRAGTAKPAIINPSMDQLERRGAVLPASQSAAPSAASQLAAPTFGNVTAAVDSTEAAASGAAGREVAGTFNGRTIYRDEVDALAGQLNGGTGAGLVNGNPTGVAAPGTAASQLASPPRITGGAQGAVIGDQNDLSNYAKQLDKQITDLGPLNMRSKRDLVGQLLGLKGRALSGQDDNAAAAARSNADLQQRSAAEQLRADVDREQIAASEKTQRKTRTQTITDAEGNVFSLDDGTAQPITTADGKQVNAGKTTKTDNTQAKLAADLLAQILPPGANAEETAAAVQQAQQSAAALMGQGGAQSTNAAPADEASFLAAARAANPGATEAELKAYYKTTYGK